MRRQFALRLVEGGPFDAEDSRTFTRLARLRNDADFHVGRDVGADAARQALADVEALVGRLADWLAASAHRAG